MKTRNYKGAVSAFLLVSSVLVTAAAGDSPGGGNDSDENRISSKPINSTDSEFPAVAPSEAPAPIALFHVNAGTRIHDPIPARIAKGNVTIELQTIVEGLISPLGMAVPDDGSGRLFVYDQAGLIYVIHSGTKMDSPLLDVRSRLVPLDQGYDERGLLGLATHPNFAQTPLIYTYTSEPNGPLADFRIVMGAPKTNDHQSVIAEWRIDPANPNRVDPSSRREILRIDKPQANHNGGTMRFGPDGFLYITIGDGGEADDQGEGHVPGGNAQHIGNILGKIIRIDVNARTSPNGQYGIPRQNPFIGQAGVVSEIYAFGLRNPYSFSFDRQTGELWLADVGQNDIEEINRITRGGNYGWPAKEGTFFFDPNGSEDGFVSTVPVGALPPDLIEPVAQYDHDEGKSVIGGFVYRGMISSLRGKYVTGDWGEFDAPNGRLFYLDNSEIKELRIGPNDRKFGQYLKGFGEDASGELYIFAGSSLGPSGVSGKVLKMIGSDLGTVESFQRQLDFGRQTFRFDTFASEKFWGDALRLHEALAGTNNGGVGPGVSPRLALEVGLKVDANAVPASVAEQIKSGQLSLDDPANTLALLRLDAVVGVKGFFDGAGKITSLGIQCAICHSTVDDSFLPGIGNRLDGWPNRDLNIGAIANLSPDISALTNALEVNEATVRSVLQSWGPGKFDAELILDGKAFRPDGKSAATLLPAAYGLAGVNLHTYTGWGSVTHWNAFVANLEMHGQGTFWDPRLNDANTFPLAAKKGYGNLRTTNDVITSKLAALHFYQLSIPAPRPPSTNFNAESSIRGQVIFNGKARCATCHVPPLFTEPGWNMHTPAEIGIDEFQANRSPDKRHRTTPLRGLFARSKGGFYHDGRFATHRDVVNHYNSHLSLLLTEPEIADLIEYLKSL